MDLAQRDQLPTAPRLTLSDPGRANVVFMFGERPKVRRTARRILGYDLEPEDYAGLVGAPDDAQVEVGVLDGRLYFELWDPASAAYHGHFYLGCKETEVVLSNDGFSINIRAMRRRGMGLAVFRRQAAHATALGLNRIEVVAGRRSDENGYYTWPRYGFDGLLPPSIRRRLPRELGQPQTVLDLMSCRPGRNWWAAHGIAIHLRFDLTPGGRSQRTLAEYVRARMPTPYNLSHGE